MPWRVPSDISIGAAQLQRLTAPITAVPFDAPTDKRLVTVGPGASTTITLPAVAAPAHGQVYAIGLSCSDFTKLRVTTRINGVPVPPYIGSLGAGYGTLQLPFPFAVPILLDGGWVFSLLLENIDGAANIDVAARIAGWVG